MKPGTRFEARVYTSNQKGRSDEVFVMRASTLKRASDKRPVTSLASGAGKTIKNKNWRKMSQLHWKTDKAILQKLIMQRQNNKCHIMHLIDEKDILDVLNIGQVNI